MTEVHHHYVNQKPYGFWAFIFDCLMIILTAGLWVIWIFVREMRRRNAR